MPLTRSCSAAVNFETPPISMIAAAVLFAVPNRPCPLIELTSRSTEDFIASTVLTPSIRFFFSSAVLSAQRTEFTIVAMC
ncbi:MAG: hypothetical protein ABI665_03805 [Vicinamibacterales bacterium]